VGETVRDQVRAYYNYNGFGEREWLRLARPDDGALDIHSALGMALYTGLLDLTELVSMQTGPEVQWCGSR
jgi:hypothetical protein